MSPTHGDEYRNSRTHRNWPNTPGVRALCPQVLGSPASQQSALPVVATYRSGSASKAVAQPAEQKYRALLLCRAALRRSLDSPACRTLGRSLSRRASARHQLGQSRRALRLSAPAARSPARQHHDDVRIRPAPAARRRLPRQPAVRGHPARLQRLLEKENVRRQADQHHPRARDADGRSPPHPGRPGPHPVPPRCVPASTTPAHQTGPSRTAPGPRPREQVGNPRLTGQAASIPGEPLDQRKDRDIVDLAEIGQPGLNLDRPRTVDPGDTSGISRRKGTKRRYRPGRSTPGQSTVPGHDILHRPTRIYEHRLAMPAPPKLRRPSEITHKDAVLAAAGRDLLLDAHRRARFDAHRCGRRRKTLRPARRGGQPRSIRYGAGSA
jgi:hypothetical protein